jgi:heme exporter protein D
MNANNPPSHFSPFLPVTMGLVALLLLLVWQFLQVREQKASLAQVERSREATVRDAQSVQGELERLARGLVELAKTDPQAKALVQKYGISVDPTKAAK